MDEDELQRLKQRVERLEKEHEITVVRMGQIQSAFDAIFSAWEKSIRETDPKQRLDTLYEGWSTAAKRLPK